MKRLPDRIPICPKVSITQWRACSSFGWSSQMSVLPRCSYAEIRVPFGISEAVLVRRNGGLSVSTDRRDKFCVSATRGAWGAMTVLCLSILAASM